MVETTMEALTVDNNSNLPPLMNPTMLEASDDLTNLSHLNEPAGTDSKHLLPKLDTDEST
jgi:myosin heavy subunit